MRVAHRGGGISRVRDDHARRRDAHPDRGLHSRFAHEGRDGRRDHRLCANGAGDGYQALGVADANLAGKMADVLARLGAERAIVFHAGNGMDELSASGPSLVIEIDGGRKEYQLDPSDLGLKATSPESVRGGGPEENARIAREILDGATGPRRDVVLLNASAALRAAGRAKDWREGIGAAAEAVDSGRAGEVLQRWATISQQ